MILDFVEIQSLISSKAPVSVLHDPSLPFLTIPWRLKKS